MTKKPLQPIAEVVPPTLASASESWLERMQHTATINGDLVAPVFDQKRSRRRTSMTRLPSAVRTVVGLGFATLLAGCGNLFNSDCVSVGLAAINVTVVAAEGAPVLTVSPRVTLLEGSYEEQAQMISANASPYRFAGGAERTGTYSVIVEADGYVTQRLDNVVVGRKEEDCNYLNGQKLTVALVRAP